MTLDKDTGKVRFMDFGRPEERRKRQLIFADQQLKGILADLQKIESMKLSSIRYNYIVKLIQSVNSLMSLYKALREPVKLSELEKLRIYLFRLKAQR